MRMVPNRQETFNSLSLGITLTVDVSRDSLETECLGMVSSTVEVVPSVRGASCLIEVSRAATSSMLFPILKCQP